MNTQATHFDLHAVNEYGFYCIPWALRKREVSRVLLNGGVNEPRTLHLIRRMVGTGDVISGGAFVGDFLPPIAGALAEGAQVHSFEPNPQAFKAALRTIGLNKLVNVNLHPVAVGAHDAVMPLQVSRRNGKPLGGMSRLVDSTASGLTVDVPVRRLDDVVTPDRAVSVIQLDVEGFEWPALLGAQRIVTEHRPVLIAETLSSSDQTVTEDRLADAFPGLGYTLMGTMERNAIFVAPDP